MTLEELNYKLTGIENPTYLTSDQKLVIEHCLVIINEIEQNSHKPVVMQAEGSDGAKGAAVGQRSVDTVAERGFDGDAILKQAQIISIAQQMFGGKNVRSSHEEQP